MIELENMREKLTFLRALILEALEPILEFSEVGSSVRHFIGVAAILDT